MRAARTSLAVRPRTRRRSSDERILPLVNIVFLLLVFFMLAGRIAAVDPFLVEPPRSTARDHAPEADIVVLLDAEGRLALDDTPLDAAALKQEITRRLSNGTAPRVRFKADGNAESTGAVAVMELLREAGVDRLTLLAVPAAR